SSSSVVSSVPLLLTSSEVVASCIHFLISFALAALFLIGFCKYSFILSFLLIYDTKILLSIFLVSVPCYPAFERCPTLLPLHSPTLVCLHPKTTHGHLWKCHYKRDN